MAAIAVGCDAVMSERACKPVVSVVAIFAVITTGHMFWVFSRSNGTIVAARAVTECCTVIKAGNKFPRIGCMAIITEITCVDMKGRF